MDSEPLIDSRQVCFAVYQSNNHFNSQAIWVFSGLLGSLLATRSKNNNDFINGVAGVSALGYLSFMALKERLADYFSDARALLITTAVPDQHESSDWDNEQLLFSHVQTEDSGQWLRYSVRTVPGSGSQEGSGNNAGEYAGESGGSSQPHLFMRTICNTQPFVNRDRDRDGDPNQKALHTYNRNCPLCSNGPCQKSANAGAITQQPENELDMCSTRLGLSGAFWGATGGCVVSYKYIAPCACTFGITGPCVKPIAIATGMGFAGFAVGGFAFSSIGACLELLLQHCNANQAPADPESVQLVEVTSESEDTDSDSQDDNVSNEVASFIQGTSRNANPGANSEPIGPPPSYSETEPPPPYSINQ